MFKENKKRPISERMVKQPTPEEIKRLREKTGLTQEKAALLISKAARAARVVWSSYEAPVDSPNHRSISLATWELFLLLVGEHPLFELKEKRMLF